MKENISSSLQNLISQSNVNLCAQRVHMVLLAALRSGKLDAAIEKVEGTISSILDTICEDEKPE